MIKVLHKLAMVTLFMSSTFYYAKGQTEVKANDFFGKEIISDFQRFMKWFINGFRIL